MILDNDSCQIYRNHHFIPILSEDSYSLIRILIPEYVMFAL